MANEELILTDDLLKDIKKDQPIMIDNLDSPYTYDNELKQLIYSRGL